MTSDKSLKSLTRKTCFHVEGEHDEDIDQNKLVHDSLKAEVALLLDWCHLVKLQKAGSGAEDVSVALSLVNRLSVRKDLFAVGARRKQIHVG